MNKFLWWRKRLIIIFFWKSGENEGHELFCLGYPYPGIIVVEKAIEKQHPGAKVTNIVPITTSWFREPSHPVFLLHKFSVWLGADAAPSTAADLIHPGDTVKLQSGGPLMTVLDVTKKGVRCGWFLGKDNQEGTFSAGALYKESPSWRGKKAEE